VLRWQVHPNRSAKPVCHEQHRIEAPRFPGFVAELAKPITNSKRLSP
jgi:hypothetical protein